MRSGYSPEMNGMVAIDTKGSNPYSGSRLCANCHAERHYNARVGPDGLTESLL